MATPDVTGGNLPGVVVDFVVDSVRDVFQGPRNVRPQEDAALRAAGFERRAWRGPDVTPVAPPPGGKWVPVYYNPATGETLSRSEAVRRAGELRAAANRPPPTPDTGVSIPALPLPAIPPIIGALPWPVIGGPIGAGVLMWPTAAGTGSDLRDLYGVPKPKSAGGRRRGRRRRTRAKPRAIPGRGNPFPAAAPGRGGPVTIRTRPAAPAAPPAARVVSPSWKPSKANLPPVKIPKQQISVRAPAGIPQTRVQKAVSKATAIAKSPLFQFANTILGSPLFSLFQPRANAPQIGRITLPGVGPSPSPLTNPLTALNPAALPYARLAPAAAAEQDCSCRPVRKKRKGKPCKNPVTSRRSFKRNGSKFVTTTKEIKCQASSRKKPALRPVP